MEPRSTSLSISQFSAGRFSEATFSLTPTVAGSFRLVKWQRNSKWLPRELKTTILCPIMTEMTSNIVEITLNIVDHHEIFSETYIHITKQGVRKNYKNFTTQFAFMHLHVYTNSLAQGAW